MQKNFKIFGKKSKPCIVIILGFLGTYKEFSFLIEKYRKEYFIIVIKNSNLSFQENSKRIIAILDSFNIKTAILFGYSFGARLGLYTYLKSKNRFSKLILESLNLGLDNPNTRKARVESDFLLAKKIKNDGLKNFLFYWYNLDLFNFSKKELITSVNKHLFLNSNNCIYFLKNLSVGKMPYLGKEMQKLNVPTLLITGNNDVKFTKSNKLISRSNKYIEHKVIKNAGHNSHFQKSNEFLKIMKKFLKK